MQLKQLKTIGQRFQVETYKKGGKILFGQSTTPLNFKIMSLQMTNNYITAPISPNLYIIRKLNNMDKAKEFKKEQDDWTRLYYKMLKRLKAMIDVQRQIQEMMKIAGEMNMTIIEMEETILKASINNRTINATNILGILEDLKYLIQSNMEDWVYQIQRMLADKLNAYSKRGN